MHTPLPFSNIHLTNQDSISPIAVPGSGTAHLGRVRGGYPLGKRSCETGAAGARWIEYIKQYLTLSLPSSVSDFRDSCGSSDFIPVQQLLDHISQITINDYHQDEVLYPSSDFSTHVGRVRKADGQG